MVFVTVVVVVVAVVVVVVVVLNISRKFCPRDSEQRRFLFL